MQINYTLETIERNMQKIWKVVNVRLCNIIRVKMEVHGPLRFGLKWTKASWATTSCEIEFWLSLLVSHILSNIDMLKNLKYKKIFGDVERFK